jgi:hypothetical protein
MSGNGYYFVGPNQTYPEIQDAIQALIDDQGSDDFTSEQKIIIAENGVYAPFKVDSDSLKPTSAARLTISSALGIQAVVSGKKSPTKSGVGCFVGNNVPYVTVERIFFRNLSRGLIFGVNAHRGVVNQCTFLECGNVGVWAYQADECTVANSILVNNQHGLVASKTRSFAAIHNTIFNDIGFSTTPTWLIFCDLQDDRGQGVEDTGTFTCVNNILMCQGGGGGVLLYEKDIPFLDMNYNAWWLPGESRFVEVRERRSDGTVSQEHLQSLELWRTRSGQDYNSINHEPGFIKPSANEAGASIDLKLLKTSFLIRKAKLLCGDPTDDLPTYVEDSYLCRDFNGKTRTSQPTIGANEVVSTNSFYGHEIFTDSDVNEDDELICGDEWSAFDRAAGQYASSVPLWFPKVHSGYFYWRDHEYYLYSKKYGGTLDQFHSTRFPLSNQLVNSNIQVVVSGVDVTDTATWRIEGLTFVLDHKDLGIESLFCDVELYGDVREWDPDIQGFVKKRTKHRWKINEGVQKYVFPSNPVSGSPIVVTDGLVGPADEVGVPQEFSVHYDDEFDVTEIRFSRSRNLWANPEFGYELEDYEYDGDVYLSESGAVDGGGVFRPLRGRYAAILPAGDTGDFIGQRHLIDPESAYTISAYGCPVTVGTGEIGLSVEFLDHEQRPISVAGDYRFPLPAADWQTGEPVEWTRFGITLWSAPDLTPERPELDVVTSDTGIAIPINAEYAMIRFHPDTGQDMGLTCIQLEQGYDATRYVRVPKAEDLTIEYETSDGGFYTVEDLTLHPVRNANSSGFLAITPIAAAELDPDAPVGSTTLSDDWVPGRTGELPWAKTSGHNKYRHVVRFGTDPRPYLDDLAPEPAVAYPATIQVSPNIVVARQGTDAEDFLVEVQDQHNNPYQFGRVNAYVADPTGEFPGYISKREWGFYTQLGQVVVSTLNEAGSQLLQWIPPEQEDVEYRGDAPTFTNSTAGWVDTVYRVYPPNHGSPVVRDQFGDLIDTEGDQITGEHYGYLSTDSTYVDLDYYPVPGTIEIYSGLTGDFSTRFEETFFPPVGEYQYYVDYENKKLTLQAGWDSAVRAVYTPRLVWKDPRYERRLYFSADLEALLTGDISVQYDAVLDLMVEVPSPTGQYDVGSIWFKFPAVAQHGDR